MAEVTYIAADSMVGVRPWTRQDRSALARWPSLETPAHWAQSGPVSGPRISYAVDLIPIAQLIGRITIRNQVGGLADLGIYLHPEWLGRGYGPAALLVMQRYLFAQDMRALTLDVAVDNDRAIRAYQRAGWEVEGLIERSGHAYHVMAVRAQ